MNPERMADRIVEYLWKDGTTDAIDELVECWAGKGADIEDITEAIQLAQQRLRQMSAVLENYREDA